MRVSRVTYVSFLCWHDDMLTCLSQYVLRALRWEEELELSRSCFEDHDILGLQSAICICISCSYSRKPSWWSSRVISVAWSLWPLLFSRFRMKIPFMTRNKTCASLECNTICWLSQLQLGWPDAPSASFKFDLSGSAYWITSWGRRRSPNSWSLSWNLGLNSCPTQTIFEFQPVILPRPYSAAPE